MGTKKISQLTPITNPSLTGVTLYDNGTTTYKLSLDTLGQTIVDSQSHNFTGSQVISGSLNVTNAVTASAFVGDGNGLTNLPFTLSGATPHVAYFNTPTSVTSSENFHSMRDGNTLALGTTAYNTLSPERLMVDNGANYNIATFQSSQANSYAEVNIRNFNHGNDASADLVLWNDVATESSSFVDLGINSSNNDGSTGGVGYGGDGYLYNFANDLYVGSFGYTSHGHTHIFGGGHFKRPGISVFGDRTIGFNINVIDTGSLETIPSSVHGYLYQFSGSVYLQNNLSVDGHVILSQVSQSLNFTNDTDAANGGVPLGGLYRNGNQIMIRLV